MYKFKKTIITSLILGLSISLSACDKNNPPVEKSASNLSISTQDPIERMVLEYIQKEIQEKRLDPKDVKQEDVLKLVRILKAVNAEGEKGREELLGKMEEVNSLVDIKTAMEGIVNDFIGDGAKEIGEKIKREHPDMIVNRVERIKNTNFYSVYLNNWGYSMITNKNIDFYITPVENNRSIIQDNKGKPIENLTDYANVYKQFLSNINKEELIKFKFGNGERELFIFTDADCPFCKKQDDLIFSTLNDKDNVTVYYIMNPLESLHPEAFEKSAKIMCSDDVSKSWKDWQTKRELPSLTNYDKEKCEEKVLNQMIYSEILGFNSTPITISGNGYIVDYTIDTPENLRKLINLK